MTNLQNNEMKNTYIFTFYIVASDRDSVVTSRLCQNWNDPQYKTADGKRCAFHWSGEYILYRHKRYQYWVRRSRRKGVNVSEIEIGCNKSVNIEISWHDAFLE